MGVAPTVYRWDDAGAPVPPGSNNNHNQANYLGDILRACLVNGYGSKVGQGWYELDFVPATSSSSGRLVLENGPQTGVAYLDLNRSYGTVHSSRVGTGWDGQLLGDAGHSAIAYNHVDDVRNLKWCVIANDASAYLLVWREPSQLSGSGLSQYNWVSMFLGSVVPWGSGINPRAAPNMVIYAPYYLNDVASTNVGKDQYGTVSLINSDGSVSVNQNQQDFFTVSGYVGPDNHYIQNVPNIPLCPVYLVNNNVGFARYPGWMGAIDSQSVSVAEEIRDADQIWTGDQVVLLGKPSILIANYHRMGFISLDEEDWP